MKQPTKSSQPRPARTVRPIITHVHPRWQIQITDDGSRTLVDKTGRIGFHSASGALTETRHVYLENSGVAERLSLRRPTSVLELGLGTTMGMLTTLAAAKVGGTHLRYVALECEWLPADLIRQLEPHAWTDEPDLAESYLRWRQAFPDHPADGVYRWPVDPHRTVEIRIGKFPNIDWDADECFDAVYFDPFAPEVASDQWTIDALAQIFSRLRENGRLTTYCVNRAVRDRLVDVGFDVKVVRGPPNGKRDVLVATRSNS